jgi:hypothetical protein
MGEVALIAHYLRTQGGRAAIAEQVRFARRRFGRYDVIDFVAVLFGYAISGERTLQVFYERLRPWAVAFMARPAFKSLFRESLADSAHHLLGPLALCCLFQAILIPQLSTQSEATMASLLSSLCCQSETCANLDMILTAWPLFLDINLILTGYASFQEAAQAPEWEGCGPVSLVAAWSIFPAPQGTPWAEGKFLAACSR